MVLFRQLWPQLPTVKDSNREYFGDHKILGNPTVCTGQSCRFRAIELNIQLDWHYELIAVLCLEAFEASRRPDRRDDISLRISPSQCCSPWGRLHTSATGSDGSESTNISEAENPDCVTVQLACCGSVCLSHDYEQEQRRLTTNHAFSSVVNANHRW